MGPGKHGVISALAFLDETRRAIGLMECRQWCIPVLPGTLGSGRQKRRISNWYEGGQRQESGGCPRRAIISVEKVHGLHHTIHQDGPDRLRAARFRLGQHPYLVRVRKLKHVSFYGLTMNRPTNTDLQPGKILVFQVVDDGGNAPVTASASFHRQPKPPNGKVKVVMNHDQLRGGNLEIAQHLANGLTAAVHIG